MNPSGEERDEGGHAPAHMDTRLNPSGQVPSCPSPGASPTTPRPITELDRLTGRRSWPLLRPGAEGSTLKKSLCLLNAKSGTRRP